MRTHENPGGAGAAARAALVLVAVAVACVLYLHAAVALDPIRKMVSDYAHTPVGATLLPVGLLAFGAALVLLARGLHVAGLGDRRVAVALATAALGLVLIAVCHGDAAGTGTTLRGLVHKLGGALLFGSLPVAGWVLAKRIGARPSWARPATAVHRLATLSAAVLAVLLISYLPDFGIALPASWLFTHTHGLVERALLVIEVALVTVPAVLAVGLVRSPGRTPPAGPAAHPATVPGRWRFVSANAGRGDADPPVGDGRRQQVNDGAGDRRSCG